MDSLLLGKTIEKIPLYLNSLFRISVQPYLISWFRYNPQNILNQINKPILLIQGTSDIQVDIEEVKFLKEACPEARMIIIDSMNHVFKISALDRQENLGTYNKPDLKNHPQLIKHIVKFLKQGEINIGGYHIWPVTKSKDAHDGYPFWSPDGNKIIYSSENRTGCQTVVYEISTNQFDTLSPEFAQHARWSPDGSIIVFDGKFGQQIEFLKNGMDHTNIVDTKGILIRNSGMPCWSPSGNEIAFTSQGRIYTQVIPDGEPKLVFEMSHKIARPFDWYKDNLLVADLRDSMDPSESDIWIIPIDSGEALPLISLPGRQVKPDISPDGKHIVFASDHEGNADIWLSQINGSDLKQLTFFKGDILNPGYDLEPSWSPDGQQIAFSSTRGGNWGIWVVEVNLK